LAPLTGPIEDEPVDVEVDAVPVAVAVDVELKPGAPPGGGPWEPDVPDVLVEVLTAAELEELPVPGCEGVSVPTAAEVEELPVPGCEAVSVPTAAEVEELPVPDV
jgi:hypothetical protein